MSAPKSTAESSLLIADLFSVKGKNVLVTVSAAFPRTRKTSTELRRAAALTDCASLPCV